MKKYLKFSYDAGTIAFHYEVLHPLYSGFMSNLIKKSWTNSNGYKQTYEVHNIHKCKLQPYQQLHTLAQGIIKVMWCEMLSMWLHFSICATIAFSALLLTQREASTQEGLSYKEKVALLLRGW